MSRQDSPRGRLPSEEASVGNGPCLPTANEEYYQLLVSSESLGCGADVPSYSVGEIERAASEFIVKNAVSVPRWRPQRPRWRPGGSQEATSFLKKK